jgi:DDE family transposase
MTLMHKRNRDEKLACGIPPHVRPDTWLHPTAQRHHRFLSCTKGAVHTWTRLSCRTFAANAVRLQLHALAYNLGNFMRMLAMPKTAEPWSLTSLREKLVKISAKIVRHGRYVTFQMAEVAVPRQMLADILSLIAQLRVSPAPA